MSQIDIEACERRWAMHWLVRAGMAAVALSLFLVWLDLNLSSSDREFSLERTLRELRTAQRSLPSSADARQLVAIPVPQPLVGSKESLPGH